MGLVRCKYVPGSTAVPVNSQEHGSNALHSVHGGISKKPQQKKKTDPNKNDTKSSKTWNKDAADPKQEYSQFRGRAL